MSILSEIERLGYFSDATNKELLANVLGGEKIFFYVGFDCTADSLHVGNLLQIMLTRLLQRHGHRPIILLGGATTRIGDPSGKDKLRSALSVDQIKLNMLGIRKSLEKFINFDKDTGAILVNNADWYDGLEYIDFLSSFGTKFSINRMLALDSVKSRLQRGYPLTFLEFNYTLLQSYDFYYLNKQYGCSLQIGGSDQWGNIISGVDFIKKMYNEEKRSEYDNGLGSKVTSIQDGAGGEEIEDWYDEKSERECKVFGLTTPLITTSSGDKMGKSVCGAIWLNEDKLSSYEYFQYWRNVQDEDVVRFARMYCDFSNDQENDFLLAAKSNINDAKKLLAYRVTALCHGEVNAIAASKAASEIFEKGGISENLPTFTVSSSILQDGGFALCSLLVDSGISKSKSEARKLIKSGGVRIFNDVVLDDAVLLKEDDFQNGLLKITVGKKRHLLIRSASD